MRYSTEPFFWSMFSAGGMVTALLLPVLIVITGFVIPTDRISYEHLHAIFSNPLIRLVLFGVAFLTFMHWANRFRHTLVDMGLKSLHTPITVGCYIAAVVGTAWAAMVVLG